MESPSSSTSAPPPVAVTPERRGPARLLSALWRRRRLVAAMGLLAAAAAAAAFVAIDRSVARLFEVRTSSFPSRVFAAPAVLERGEEVGAEGDPVLADRLRRLGYRDVRGEPKAPGTFQRSGRSWVIHLRSAAMPEGLREPFVVRVVVRRGRIRSIVDLRDEAHLDRIALEPEPLFAFYGERHEERHFTPLDEIPVFLRDAVVAVEDRRFRDHHGLDLVGIGRALLANVKAGGVVQGGSTVTQQLVKNLYGPGRRTLRRKLVEAVGAVALEIHRDKDEILEAYLNEVYLGQTGPVAVSGVGDAARFYFGREVGEIDRAGQALLAGLIQSPGRYNPRLHADAARERRDLVLGLMHEQGLLDDAGLRAALRSPLGVVRAAPRPDRFPWIEDYLAQAIQEVAPEAVPARAGFSILTTFDPRVETAASEALESGLKRLDRRVAGAAGLEGAIVVLRPSDGALLALVGGRDFATSQFNRAVLARRPPGSVFTPFVVAAAFERALREPGFSFTPATVLEDEPLTLRAGGRPWSPGNFDATFRGPVSARDALELSINVPTVRAALMVGLDEVVATARRCGIASPLQPVPSLALGSEAVTPLEMAVAYAALANGGRRVAPRGLAAVIGPDGSPVAVVEPATERALDPRVAYLTTDLLTGVMERGTARAAVDLGFVGIAAGKTGTSDDLRDAWFVGYTADVLAVVWVGYDDNRPVGLSGAAAALPIWVDLMRRLGIEGGEDFPPPPGIVRMEVDRETGQRATWRCRDTVEEIFAEGTEPRERCERHGGRRGFFFWRRDGTR